MSVRDELLQRSNHCCELCGSDEAPDVYIVGPKSGEAAEECVMTCGTCREQLKDPDKVAPNHWRCLNESMWSEVPAVQVVAWRMLNRLRAEGWPADLLEMMYMEEETRKWAEEGGNEDAKVVHKDSNGNVLQAGDTVTLIKDLVVKGANFTAKRGVAVRRISLVADNAEQIEGKVDGQRIVILTKFVKKIK